MIIPGIEPYIRPNSCRWFPPDPGYTFFEVDLKQADAQVVAWDSDDTSLKETFRVAEAAPPQPHGPVCPCLHCQNCLAIFGEFQPRLRQLAKAGVHAANYLVTARTLAKTLGVSTRVAQTFIDKWFELHPAIPDWHERIATQLQTTREIYNAFGYRIYWFDRISKHSVKDLLAWIAQSTVAEVVNRGMRVLHRRHPEIHLLMQRHDSLAGQFPTQLRDESLRAIFEATRVAVPYPDPLIIGREIAVSDDSWGAVKEIPWPEGCTDACH